MASEYNFNRSIADSLREGNSLQVSGMGYWDRSESSSAWKLGLQVLGICSFCADDDYDDDVDDDDTFSCRLAVSYHQVSLQLQTLQVLQVQV